MELLLVAFMIAAPVPKEARNSFPVIVPGDYIIRYYGIDYDATLCGDGTIIEVVIGTGKIWNGHWSWDSESRTLHGQESDGTIKVDWDIPLDRKWNSPKGWIRKKLQRELRLCDIPQIMPGK